MAPEDGQIENGTYTGKLLLNNLQSVNDEFLISRYQGAIGLVAKNIADFNFGLA